MSKDNKSIGRFRLDGIPPAPRGVPQIEVTFDIDANGILHVTAKDLGTGKEQKITITASSGLSEKDIENMVKEAEKYSQQDKDEKEKIEVRNRADSTIYQTEKQLKEFEAKLPDNVKKPIQEKIEQLKKAKEKDDTLEMKKILNEMEQLMQKMGEEIYKNAGGSGKQPDPSSFSGSNETKNDEKNKKESKTDEKVVDAEIIDEEN